jgi:hypothetical protein
VIGQSKAVRVEAPNGLHRLTYDIDDNRIEGFSDEAFMRSQPAWAGDQLWTVPVSPGEFPAGAAARITDLDLRGYQDMRLVVQVGSPGGPAGAQLLWSFSLDGGATWTPTLATVTLDEANQTLWGPWQPIPPTLRQTIDARLALFGQGGNGSAQVRILEVALDIRSVDQTSAARLLPSKITPRRSPIRSRPSFAASRRPMWRRSPAAAPAVRRRRLARSRLPDSQTSLPTPRRRP